MATTPTTFEFDVTLDDLLYAEGVAGLNDILDERMTNDPQARFEGQMATDISYEALTVTPGDTNIITISATFTPDYLYGEPDEDESEVDAMDGQEN